MKILNNININTSLKIKSNAKYYVELRSKKDFNQFQEFISNNKLPILIVGEGTNLVLPNFYKGIVVKPIFNLSLIHI